MIELSPSNVLFAIGIIGTIFTVYNYFRNPQVNDDKRAALLAQQVQATSTAIEQRFKFVQDASDSRFKALQDSFQSLLLQSNNHVHTVDVKVDALHGIVDDMSKEIVKLQTIIDERIPKK